MKGIKSSIKNSKSEKRAFMERKIID